MIINHIVLQLKLTLMAFPHDIVFIYCDFLDVGSSAAFNKLLR